MSLFQNKYRSESTRLKNWDYSKPGAYFITICTAKMKNFFGEIEVDDKLYSVDEIKKIMKLNVYGKIVEKEWLQTEKIRNNVILDEFIVMPNHFHGIIMLTNDCVETTRRVVSPNTVPHPLETNKHETTHRVVSTTLKSNSLGSIIGQFKSICTKRIHDAGLMDFFWQERFYDHIIRSEKSLNKIRDYIIHNPIKWKYDKYYKENRKY
jgi:REP element-mobilizing transposase RayT